MNDLEKAKFLFEITIEHLTKGVFIHQETYIIKVHKMF